ncbi:MAG TPA: tetratricopeptide repeat protein [Flavobacteriales bacterium]|nr:tetratricopeptide repeat protein [Flavobacteriales bacterium]
MRNSKLKSLSFIAVLAVIATGCGLGKMIKKYEEVKYTVTPEILEVHGGRVSVKISGKVPAKYFHKKATATFTPVIKWEDGELALNPITVIGEAAEGQGQKIGYGSGGTFTYVDTIPYKKAMKKSEVFAKVGLAMGSKTSELPDRLLTSACIITSTRVANDEDVMFGADKYEKETIITQKGEVYYPIQSAVIPSSEMRSASTKALKEFIANKYETRSVTITAWASPDGPEDLNLKISNDRTNSAFKYVQKELKRMKLEGADKDELYTKVSKGEYWDGFNQLVGASSIEDKQLILDIVNRHTDVNKREEEIKNLAVVYLTLAKDILPKLRKAEISINSLEPKKTDAEIDSLATAKPDTLDVEELFYAATLTEDLDKKLKIFESASQVYADDWRGYNNVAYIHMKKGNLDDAKAWLDKAKGVSETAEVQNNYGVLAIWNGDLVEARGHYEASQSNGGNVSNNLGILHVRTGDYETALEYFGSDCSYNSALANLLNGDAEKAKDQGECAAATAATSYLKAIIAARMDDATEMGKNLKSAVGGNASYRKDAITDLEFSNFWDSMDFKGAIQ